MVIDRSMNHPLEAAHAYKRNHDSAANGCNHRLAAYLYLSRRRPCSMFGSRSFQRQWHNRQGRRSLGPAGYRRGCERRVSW